MGDILRFPHAETVEPEPDAEDGAVAFVACDYCRNKTFTLHPCNDECPYPLCVCAACGHVIGHMGWLAEKPPCG